MAQIVPLQQARVFGAPARHLVVGEISAASSTDNRLAVFSDEDIFGPPRQAAGPGGRALRRGGRRLPHLKEGDLVVHCRHGIARYDGLTR